MRSVGLIKCVLWACPDFSSVQAIFGDSIKATFEGASIHATTIKLPAWQVVLTDWHQPDRQHDAGKFLIHLASRCPNLLSLLQCTWQSMFRGSGDMWEVAEASTSACLILDSMLVNHADRSFCLLQVVNLWHLQAYVHVMIESPCALAILAGRFRVENGSVAKSQHVILPDQELQIPAFLNGEFSSVSYQLNSYIVHLGEAPSSGHYLAVMFDVTSGTLYCADDNAPVRILNDRELELFHRNSYLFVYKCNGRNVQR